MAEVDLLKQYREKDMPERAGEVRPENETLNSRRIAEFLRNKFNLEAKRSNDEDLRRFDDQFKLGTAKELAQSGQTAGEKEMFEILGKAEGLLTELGASQLFEKMNEKTAAAELRKFLEEKGKLDEFK